MAVSRPWIDRSHARDRCVVATPVLEFPQSGADVGWLSFEGLAVAMLMLGLGYCALRAMLTGVRQAGFTLRLLPELR